MRWPIPHLVETIAVLLSLGFWVLVAIAVLWGIRWAVANGIRDAQKMAERDRLAATGQGQSSSALS